MSRSADAGGFLLAFPETESEWNDPSDQNFVTAVIDAVVAQDQADPQRVFAAGRIDRRRQRLQPCPKPFERTTSLVLIAGDDDA